MDLAGAISQRPGQQDVTGTSVFTRLFLLNSTLSDSMTKSGYVVFTNMLNRHSYDLIRRYIFSCSGPSKEIFIIELLHFLSSISRFLTLEVYHMLVIILLMESFRFLLSLNGFYLHLLSLEVSSSLNYPLKQFCVPFKYP